MSKNAKESFKINKAYLTLLAKSDDGKEGDIAVDIIMAYGLFLEAVSKVDKQWVTDYVIFAKESLDEFEKKLT